MKKQLFLISIILAMGSTIPAKAQVYSTSPISNSGNGIIRERNIAYVEEAGGVGYFVYFGSLDGMSPSFSVKVPDGWAIKDFHVIDTTAYFCGTNTRTNTALLGHFGISNLVSGTGNTIYHYDLNKLGLAVLNRMAVSGDKQAGSIIAIGREDNLSDPDTKGADHVLYVEDYHGTGVCRLFFLGDKDELFWDVAKTDNYFVVAGTYNPISDKMIMRRVPIGVPAANFVMDFEIRHEYSSPYYFASGICMEALNNDSVIMASYYQTPPRTALQLFTLSAATGQMDYNQYCGTMPLGVLSLAPPTDMAYLNNCKELMLIDTVLFGLNHFYRLDPYPTTWMYVPPYYYYDNGDTLHYSSLQPVPPNSFMAAEKKGWVMLDLSVLPSTPGTNACLTSYTTDLFTVPPLSVQIDTKGKDTPHQISLGTAMDIINNHRLSVRCPE